MYMYAGYDVIIYFTVKFSFFTGQLEWNPHEQQRYEGQSFEWTDTATIICSGKILSSISTFPWTFYVVILLIKIVWNNISINYVNIMLKPIFARQTCIML